MGSQVFTTTLGEVATRIGGKLLGDPQQKVVGLCAAEDPKEDCLAFVRKVYRDKTASQLQAAAVAGVLVASNIEPESLPQLNLIVVPDPLASMVDLAPLFRIPSPAPEGISTQTSIHPSARLGKGVAVAPFVSIGSEAIIEDGVVLYSGVTVYPRARVGANSVLHSHVVLREDCSIGKDCTIHDGTVIGADGFGYIPGPQSELVKVPQFGNVHIGDRVEIGANSCIDRATFGTTWVGSGTKIDNFVQLGHNVQVGKNCIICAHAKVGGSTKLDDGVVLGGGSSVADHLTLVSGVRVGGHAGVTSSLMEPGDYGGYPIVPAPAWRRQSAALGRLPDVLRKLRNIIRSEEPA